MLITAQHLQRLSDLDVPVELKEVIKELLRERSRLHGEVEALEEHVEGMEATALRERQERRENERKALYKQEE